jgi:hypothetical protein
MKETRRQQGSEVTDRISTAKMLLYAAKQMTVTPCRSGHPLGLLHKNKCLSYINAELRAIQILLQWKQTDRQIHLHTTSCHSSMAFSVRVPLAL